MFIITYTLYRRVGGQHTNIYKSKSFASYSDATAFYNKLQKRAHVSNVRFCQ